MSVETEVQAALFTALTGAGLTVYDHAPQATDGGAATAWPYVEVGAVIFTEWDTCTELGHSFLARVHTRSRSRAAQEAKAMQGVIYDTLHRHELTLTGFTNVVLVREMSDCTRVADGSFHGVCEYRGLVQAT